MATIDKENGEISEDEFYDTYVPEDREDIDPGYIYFETYGDDLEKVKKHIPLNRVWTVMDGDGKDLIVSSGAWFVNRLNYIITDKPWTGNPGDIWVTFD